MLRHPRLDKPIHLSSQEWMLVLRFEIEALHRSIAEGIRDLHTELGSKLADLSQQKAEVLHSHRTLLPATDQIRTIFPVSILATSALQSHLNTVREQISSLNANRDVPASAQEEYRAAFESRAAAIVMEQLVRSSSVNGYAGDANNPSLAKLWACFQYCI